MMLNQTRSFVCAAALTAFLCAGTTAQAAPPGAAITYQGTLAQNGSPVDGLRDFRFRLYESEVGGTPVESVQLFSVDVVEGIFSVEIDFGLEPWTPNEQYWLEIEVGPADMSQTYEVIGRQNLTAAPYALNTRGLSVDAIGSLGVGTQAPAARLDVQGTNNGKFRVYDLPPDLVLMTQLLGSWEAPDAGPQVRFQGAPGGGFIDIGQDGIGSFVIEPGDVPRLTVTADGRVGLGTSDPAATLHLAPSSGSASLLLTGSGQQEGINLAVGSNGLAVGKRASDGSSFEFLGRWQFDGDLGVGTDTPQSRLDVRFSEGNGIEVTDTSGGSPGIGVHSTIEAGTAVRGDATGASGAHFGVYGQAASLSGWGVFSNGRLGASGTKSFIIDHPLDPTGKYLLHYSSESPEPQNRYNGNVYLDARGVGVVALPHYFQAINRDFRYTLTPIGSAAPNLHVAREIEGNAFVVAGGSPGQKVSWEVTAVRNDAFVRQRGAPVEINKVGRERGLYLTPWLYGAPEGMGIHHPRQDR